MSTPNCVPSTIDNARILAAIEDTFQRMTSANALLGLEMVMGLVVLFRRQEEAAAAAGLHCSEPASLPSPEQKRPDIGVLLDWH